MKKCRICDAPFTREEPESLETPGTCRWEGCEQADGLATSLALDEVERLLGAVRKQAEAAAAMGDEGAVSELADQLRVVGIHGS